MTVSEELLQLWVPLLQELDTAFPNFVTELITAMVERLGAGSGFMIDQTLFLKESPPVSIFILVLLLLIISILTPSLSTYRLWKLIYKNLKNLGKQVIY